MRCRNQSISDGRPLDVFDAGDDKPHLTSHEATGLSSTRSEHTDQVRLVLLTGRSHNELVAFTQLPLLHPHQADHSQVIVEPRINNQCLQGCITVALRGRHIGDEVLQNVLDTKPGLRTDWHSVSRINADNFLNLLLHPVWVRLRQIHFVEHWKHFQSLLNRGVTVSHRLRLDTLASIDNQQRAFASGQRPGDLVGKIDVPGRIDEVELIDATVTGRVVQRHTLGFDSDATLPLQVHRIKNLLCHLSLGQPATVLDEAIRQRGFTMVDMSDNRKITNMTELSHFLHTSKKVRPAMRRADETKCHQFSMTNAQSSVSVRYTDADEQRTASPDESGGDRASRRKLRCDFGNITKSANGPVTQSREDIVSLNARLLSG